MSKTALKQQSVPQSNPTAKDMLIAQRNKNIVQAQLAIDQSNVRGWKHTAIKMHYMNKEGSDFIANCSAEIVTEALLDAGMIILSNVGDTVRFHVVTDGEILAERTWWPRQDVERTVRDYCMEHQITGKGLPINGK